MATDGLCGRSPMDTDGCVIGAHRWISSMVTDKSSVKGCMYEAGVFPRWKKFDPSVSIVALWAPNCVANTTALLVEVWRARLLREVNFREGFIDFFGA